MTEPRILDTPTHGITAYRRGCRCDECSAAMAAAYRRNRIPCPNCGEPMDKQAKQCKPCAVKARIQHGTISSYRRGCRCEPCIEGARETRRRQWHARRVPCPECGEPMHQSADQCIKCTKGRIAIEPVHLIDLGEVSNPSWRPPHYPPACLSCNGFGYLAGSWSPCPACRAFPGHAMSHADWTALRA